MTDGFPKFSLFGPKGIRIPISTSLIVNYMLIIVLISTVFVIVGLRLINDRIVTEAQEGVRHDLNAAREIYLGELRHIMDVVQLSANHLRIHMEADELDVLTGELAEVRESEGLDILTLTDPDGNIILRSHNPLAEKTDLRGDKLYEIILRRKEPFAATQIKNLSRVGIKPVIFESEHADKLDVFKSQVGPDAFSRVKLVPDASKVAITPISEAREVYRKAVAPSEKPLGAEVLSIARTRDEIDTAGPAVELEDVGGIDFGKITFKVTFYEE